MPFISEISASASPTRVEMVSNSVSRRLLSKFSDVSSEIGFNYSQSRLWSPPFQPRIFLSSPGNAIVTQDDMLLRLRKITRLRRRRRHGICFNVCTYAFRVCKHSHTFYIVTFFEINYERIVKVCLCFICRHCGALRREQEAASDVAQV